MDRMSHLLLLLLLLFLFLKCSSSAENNYTFVVNSQVTLPACSALGGDGDDDLIWRTPSNQIWASNSNATVPHSQVRRCFKNATERKGSGSWPFFSEARHVYLDEKRNLVIRHFGWGDRGNYTCQTGHNEEVVTRLHLDQGYRNYVYYLSLIYGFAVAGAFLLLTLLFKLVYYLLETYGCCLCCCCCENRLPPKAQKIKNALDSIELYKQQQLDKLKENYTQQSDWIRENCACQMERVRENYNSQVQNVRDIKQYGSTQIQAVREQYYEQMHRIRDYSTSQLDRVHENYIFQRQRLRKFSAQNYLRMRATGKYTQRTLNKVMENLPPLYLDLSNCRQGMGGRQESIHFPAELNIAELEPLDIERELNVRKYCIEVEEDEDDKSLYYTPPQSSSPTKRLQHLQQQQQQQKSNSLKNTPVREADANAYRAVYDVQDVVQTKSRHRKSKSFSHFLPQKFWFSSSTNSSQCNISSSAGTTTTGLQVEAVIERVNGSNDYLDIEVDIREEEKESFLSQHSDNNQDGIPHDEDDGGMKV